MSALDVLVRQLQARLGTYDLVGTGDPNGVVVGPIGATYRRLDGGAATSLYVKESDAGGDTGWIGK